MKMVRREVPEQQAVTLQVLVELLALVDKKLLSQVTVDGQVVEGALAVMAEAETGHGTVVLFQVH
jgi:hypothetical protein